MSNIDGFGRRPPSSATSQNQAASSTRSSPGGARPLAAGQTGSATNFGSMGRPAWASQSHPNNGPTPPVCITLRSGQSAEEAVKRAENLGFTAQAPAAGNGAALHLSIDNATSNPYLCMPQKLYRPLHDLINDGSQQAAPVISPDEFERDSINCLKDLITRDVRSMDANIHYGLSSNWNDLSSHSYGCLSADDRLPPNQQMPQARKLALQAADSRIRLCEDFAFGAYGISERFTPGTENKSFRKICQEHGLPAAMRIASHYRATVESPLWRYLFPDAGSLPREFEPSFRDYAAARQNAVNPNNIRRYDSDTGEMVKIAVDPLHVLLGNSTDKLDQDIRLCAKMRELTDLELSAVIEHRAALVAGSSNSQNNELQNQISLLDQEAAHLTRKLQSLDAMRDVLRVAKVTPEIQLLLDTQGYTKTLNAAGDLWDKHRYPVPPARDELEAHTIDAKSKIFLRALTVRVAELGSDEQMAALRELLSDPSLAEDMKDTYALQYDAIQQKNFHTAQVEEALELAANSTQFSGIEATLGSDRAQDLAVGAWRVAAEANFRGDLVVNGQTAAQVEIFDAVLCWMALILDNATEVQGGSQSTPETVAFALNNKDLAIAALERFQTAREAEARSAKETGQPAQLEEWPRQLLDGIQAFQP
jgi:hypothetical protein